MPHDPSSLSALGVEIRPMRGLADYHECLALQNLTWGNGFREAVPAAMLMVTQKVGGITAGAFDADGVMIGFVYGITGWKEGKPCHWSHMLAVHPDWRDQGIGRALKNYQRDELLRHGVRTMYWTFDPLVARNAHLNLVRLGACVTEYIPDIYGSNAESTVDSVIGTDRFIVRWQLDQETPTPPIALPDTDVRVVTLERDSSGRVGSQVGSFGPFDAVRIDVPPDIQVLKERDPEAAIAWRLATRSAFLWYLERGYRVTTFIGDAASDGCSYRLEAKGTPP